ncbi:MAG: response regulator transcription factor [Acidimicrobiia bacterium]|nr:response regulator transcription factor [Acidimicrobiia bacterium]
MNVFLVDDEPLALKRLTRLLQATGRVQVSGSESDPERAVERIRSQPPDALFLDIEMPGMTGFDLLSRLPSDPLVVFTTAYDRYALRAFEVNSVDYLLKPVEPDQLDRALTKLERMLGGSEPRVDIKTLAAQLAQALEKREPEHLTRIASKLGDRVEFIETAQITHFYAKDKLTYAATAAKHHVVDLTIADLEEKLDPQRFIRIHRSTIVSFDAIRELYTWFGGRLLVRLKDGKTELNVARDRVTQLKSKLGV